ncbi:MFS transporter [Enterococcus raffinosus]|uniref:MFS transporter n=1 Tax=Enterococcus raffinosus TaxID=71452 RepID=UPI001C95AD5B|nr:MFS transporter [Enterococcus raffinosus]MDT2525017.1 MFS transporter [Enterococcus raffinosus]MDT2531489.1 MFS transporter [Enterococcus raffinosus]MDT2532865.1 MFS transporter [Enterococcus raffinosus]MDT2556533.1 MFS transporter [Enterococcus raffinosus]MDT2576675.1 MFS transporter [Enterococcus raffinosus]
MKGNKKNISYLMLGQFISVFGGAILRFALSLFVLDVTGRADIFATVLAISSIPVLFAPIGGAIADRFDRKLLMVLMDVANAIIAGLLFLVVGTTESILGIGVLIFILAIVGSFDTPVVGASIPLLVEEEELEKINGLSNGILQLSNVVAPIIGGSFYGVMGAKLLVASSILFFIIAAIIESFLKIPFEKRKQSSGTIMQILTADLKDGFKEVKNNQVIFKSITIAAAINFVLTSFFIVGLPVILRMTLQVNDTMYGIGMGVFSFASIIGAIFAGQLTKNIKFNNFYRVFTLSGILLILMNLLLSMTSIGVGFMVVLVMEIIIGMMLSAISIYLITIVQRITPKENLGKVMATIIAVAQCAVPLGQLLMGLIFRNTTDSVFVPLLLISGLVLLISGACFMMFRETKESDIYTAKD